MSKRAADDEGEPAEAKPGAQAAPAGTNPEPSLRAILKVPPRGRPRKEARPEQKQQQPQPPAAAAPDAEALLSGSTLLGESAQTAAATAPQHAPAPPAPAGQDVSGAVAALAKKVDNHFNTVLTLLLAQQATASSGAPAHPPLDMATLARALSELTTSVSGALQTVAQRLADWETRAERTLRASHARARAAVAIEWGITHSYFGAFHYLDEFSRVLSSHGLCEAALLNLRCTARYGYDPRRFRLYDAARVAGEQEGARFASMEEQEMFRRRLHSQLLVLTGISNIVMRVASVVEVEVRLQDPAVFAQ